MAKITPTDTNELATADEQLKQLEAEQATELVELGIVDKPDDTTPSSDRALEGDKVDDKAEPDSKDTSDTPLDADKEDLDKAKAEADKEGKELAFDDKGVPKRDEQGKFVKQDKKPVEQPIVLTPEERTKFDKYLGEKSGSKYGKDFTRRLVTWTEINSEKERLAATKQNFEKTFADARAKFDADVQAFQAEKANSTPTPEKYEAFASKCAGEAKIKLAEAITAENEGRIEEAEKLRDEAKFLNRDAQSAAASAEHVRKNPPPNQQQVQQKFVEEQKVWIGKAVQDFPDFGKKDSDLQKGTAEAYKTITATNPAFSKIPELVYFCAEFASLQSAANRVPDMEKELGELRTKVKDLDALTNPTPASGVQSSNPRAKINSDEDEFEELKRMAASRR